MKTTHLKILVLILAIPIQLISQSEVRFTGFGLNLPPLIGNTISLDADLHRGKLYSMNIGIGGMLKNKLPGTLYQIGQWTDNHENSGVYTSMGFRYTPGKELNKSYFFIGAKLIGGYFLQSANYKEPSEGWFKDNIIPADYYFVDDRVYSEGFFTAFAIETGINIKISKKVHTEIGLQGGHHLFTTKRQVSSYSSILPGLGSLNVVGILKIKYIIQKQN